MGMWKIRWDVGGQRKDDDPVVILQQISMAAYLIWILPTVRREPMYHTEKK
jgi:hypothetical protein